MKIILDTLEVVWLQNIKRQPGFYALGQTDDQVKENKHYVLQKALIRHGLVKTNKTSSMFWDRLYITKLGEQALKECTPVIDKTLKFPYDGDHTDQKEIELTVFSIGEDGITCE